MAVSSFSENGWVLKDGTQRTHQLLGLFTSKFGKPARVYAAGAWMDGFVEMDLVEPDPYKSAGLLPACAVAGGVARQVDFMANVRVFFDLFYPGVLPGTAVNVPAGIDTIQDIVNPAIEAMTFDGTGAFAIASIAQTPVQFADGPELVESIATALGGAARYPDILGLTHGRAYFDNTATQYHGRAPRIDAGVHQRECPAILGHARQAGTPWSTTTRRRASWGSERSHSRCSRDPVIPAFHRAMYGQAVEANGGADWLVQR